MTREVSTKIWYPAIYARLSDEDKKNKGKKKDVSLSIEHQTDIMTDFVRDKGWQEPKIFFDDARTGTNFDREGFQSMYAEAQSGAINVVIVNDITRFGRNAGQSSTYFDSLSDMGVRFISIQENIDTENPICPSVKILPFYFIFAEWFSDNISGKIRSVFKAQNEAGEHRSSRPPYGYNKNPSDKHKLIVDPDTAPIVRRIFDMRLQKMSFGSIAKALNAEGVVSPNGLSVEKKDIKNNKPRLNKWSASSIILVTSNPTYCGDVVQNRVGCASYKNQKQKRKSPSEWVTVRDKHEPLVSREDFQACEDMRENVGRVRSTQYAQISPFTGLIKCPDCGYTLTRTSTYYTVKATGEKKLSIAYNCGAYANMGKTACTSHYISENDLKELVIADIREKAGAVILDENGARERFYAIKSQESTSQLKINRSALKKVEQRLSDLDKLLAAAFEKMVLGGESAALFAGMERKYQTEKQELIQQRRTISALIDKYSKTETEVETFIGLMKQYANITDLDRATAVELIDRITVSASKVKPREIVIYYNLIGSIE